MSGWEKGRLFIGWPDWWLMGERLDQLESEVAGLTEEVRFLRRELGLLRKELINRREGGYTGGGSADSRPESPGPSLSSYSLVQAGPPPSPDRHTTVSAPARVEQTPVVLTWGQRDSIAQEVGRFLVRALAGLPRGPSGRDQVPLASRVWIVARTFEGELLNLCECAGPLQSARH